MRLSGKRVFKEEEKAEIVERYKRSGLRQKNFCEQEGISVSALQCWKRKGAGDVASKFVELPVERGRAAVGGSIELRLPHGIVLKIEGQSI